MIVAFSTSSPLTSVAILRAEGEILWKGSALAPGRASESCVELLRGGLSELGRSLTEATLFVADQGPGSFTGIRVGVVLAKTFAWNFATPCAGIDAFNLIASDRPVAIPARKREFFLRLPSREIVRVESLPENTVGYGFEGQERFPEAFRVGSSLSMLETGGWADLMPEYRMEPSISVPKRALSRVPD